ncbi:hypothetical protein ACVU7I_07840 [Patulibacter sp. S7RM1-6]
MPRSPLRSTRVRRLVAALVAAASVAGVAGCGQVDERGAGVRVLVTTDDGARTVLDRRGVEAKDEESALAVLQRVARVELAPGRQAPAAIDGVAARGAGAWRLWLNGTALRSGEMPAQTKDVNLQLPPVRVTPRATKVHEGDTLWFDLRSGAETASEPRGVVGTFPEPFEHGAEGKRWPVRVECADPRGQACRMVRDALVRYGIPAVSNLLRTSYNPESARIAVGTWREIRFDPAAGLAERGPEDSGVFATPAKDGRSIALQDRAGKTVRTLGAGAGLILGSRYRDEPPSWAVTGTDAAGVLRAAGALDATALKAHLAVAIDGGNVVPLPVRAAAR